MILILEIEINFLYLTVFYLTIFGKINTGLINRHRFGFNPRIASEQKQQALLA
jgi:hypothetical protein